MKRLLLLVIISSLIISCGGRKVNKKMVRTLIGGEWILKSYIDELRTTGSPYKAGEKLKGITEMKIITDIYDRNDSINVTAALNNHEGYSFKLFLEKTSDAIKVNAFPNEVENTDKYEIRFDLKKDSLIQLVRLDDKGDVAESTEFVKLNKEPDANANLTLVDYYAINTILSGNFKLLDANQKELSDISFYNTGKVDGFQNYSCFRLLTDFIASGVEFDFLMLGNDNKSFISKKDFGMKINKDKIELYSVVTDSTEFFMQMDKLEYILKRK